MRIALFGGRFDPPHNGHVQIAKYVLAHGPQIQEVWFIPANTHPWRQIIAPAQDRFMMVKQLEERGIKASNIDVNRGGDTFTIDTVTECLRQKQQTFYWIFGSDQIEAFPKWKEYKKLQEVIKFLVIPRPGYMARSLGKHVSVLTTDYNPIKLSSSEIRDRIAQGLSIHSLVPSRVACYIEKKGLYKHVQC